MVSWIFFLDQLHYLASSYPETPRSIVRRSPDPDPISSDPKPLSYGAFAAILGLHVARHRQTLGW